MTTTPDDLVPVREAARLVDRSTATIRAWVRAGELRVYRGEGTHEANRPALVSRAELLNVAGVTKAPHPPRPPRREEPVSPSPAASTPSPSPGPSSSPSPSVAELDALRALAASREETAAAVRSTVAALEARCVDLSAALDRERARADGLEAEISALRATQGLPWWRRLLPG